MALSAGLGGPAGGPQPALTHPNGRVSGLHGRLPGSTVASAKGPVVWMGASAHLRWGMIVVAALLATAGPAVAQQSAGPDAAPTGSKAPRPDPAPLKSTPKATVVRPAARPVVTTTVRPAPPVATARVRRATKPVHRATTHRKRPVRHQPLAQTAERRAYIAAPRVPRLSLAHLSVPPATNDAGRARKLAAAALSLLVLALASATLLAFTARVERRRVVR